MAVETLFADGTLVKVGVFVLVQALVYLILSGSSTLFSDDKARRRLGSFRTARSVSIRRMLAMLSDMPPEGEPSPSSSSAVRPPFIPEAEPYEARE